VPLPLAAARARQPHRLRCRSLWFLPVGVQLLLLLVVVVLLLMQGRRPSVET